MTATLPAPKRPAWPRPLFSQVLTEDLTERILARLGFQRRPEPTREALRDLYARWCRKVPFDNVRKLIHVRSGDSGPLPGSTPADFFTAWLDHGTGGTCWAGSGALHALLGTLGFEASRGIATMLAAPHLPPNHGTVTVTFDTERYLVDSAVLHGEPLQLAGETASVSHPAWGVTARLEQTGTWLLDWRALHKPEGFQCRYERFFASAAEYRNAHENTRGWSPFNYQVSARLNQGEGVAGLAFGKAVTLPPEGGVVSREVTHTERMRLLIEEIGLSEEIVGRLPVDIPTPPPPGPATTGSAST